MLIVAHIEAAVVDKHKVEVAIVRALGDRLVRIVEGRDVARRCEQRKVGGNLLTGAGAANKFDKRSEILELGDNFLNPRDRDVGVGGLDTLPGVSFAGNERHAPGFSNKEIRTRHPDFGFLNFIAEIVASEPGEFFCGFEWRVRVERRVEQFGDTFTGLVDRWRDEMGRGFICDLQDEFAKIGLPHIPTVCFKCVVDFELLARHRNNDILVPDDQWDFVDESRWTDTWLGGLDMDEMSFEEPSKEMSVTLAWTPYLLVALILLVTRWPGLTIGGVEVLVWVKSFTVSIDSILGTDLGYTLSYLYLPGTMPFVPIAILTGLLHTMDTDQMATAWRDSIRQVAPAALTLIIAVSMTQVMIQSKVNPADLRGMMQAMSRVLAIGAGGLLPVVTPWIGALGTFMTGSNTSSNILFTVLQFNAAADVGISRTIVVSLQNVGGGFGNMASVLNIAAICGVIGITGRKGDLLRKVIVPMAIYAVFAGGLGLLFVYVLVPNLF